eukprot:tig00001187_g7457.t1
MPYARFIGKEFQKELIGYQSPGPARYAHQRSSFGRLPSGHEEPSFSFSQTNRDEPGRSLGPSFAVADMGRHSPGPVYKDPREAIGRSEIGGMRNEPSFTFPHGPRAEKGRFISKVHSAVERQGLHSPGPVYSTKSSLEEQNDSSRRTEPSFSFGAEGRFTQAVYIGPLHSKVQGIGEASPGPRYAPPPMTGMRSMVHSTGPSFSFAGRDREMRLDGYGQEEFFGIPAEPASPVRLPKLARSSPKRSPGGGM